MGIGRILLAACATFMVLRHADADTTPAVGDLTQAKDCAVTSSLAIAGRLVGQSEINMANDGGWCWLTLWATLGDLRYAPEFNVTQAPQHGQLLMGAVQNNARVAYMPATGFTGGDTFTLVDKTTGTERTVTVSVAPGKG
jgi:type II secretion system GspH-like protein